ncbi:Gfo/Idh/MocA family oxidoreductase [Paenibacillus tritici]|uniref:Gfo/Idh/MocA family oxidoreductase n=2 Tax=Paenibacillus tritici TaxID=1873425 RepID=A0ABX2DX58_9BACL|nr:Gfo/Idh/MocA family oxidoreductase [Paenibacillus tritici]NQX49286.1 Gfo/Idh/MocA family oxidoreductase [Paenibacillus tritici]
MKLGIGIIGCGRITEKHAATLSRLGSARVVAISDISIERMEIIHGQLTEAAGHTANEIAMYPDYADLLIHPEVNVIVIATSSGHHADMAGDALIAGKHVIIEKPLALTLEDSRLLSKLASQRGLNLLVCHQMRYRLPMLRIKNYITSGLLGDLYYGVASIEISRTPDYFRQAAWRGTWDQDGGMLLNQGIHLIDLLLWFLGDVEGAYGELQKLQPGKEIEDVALAVLSFRNGTKGLVEANTVTRPGNFGYSLRLFAEKGTLIISGNQLERIERFEVRGVQIAEEELRRLEADRDEQLRMYEAYLDRIQNGPEGMVVDAPEASKSLEAIFAIYRSALEGRRVTLPLTEFSTEIMKAGKWHR